MRKLSPFLLHSSAVSVVKTSDCVEQKQCGPGVKALPPPGASCLLLIISGQKGSQTKQGSLLFRVGHQEKGHVPDLSFRKQLQKGIVCLLWALIWNYLFRGLQLHPRTCLLQGLKFKAPKLPGLVLRSSKFCLSSLFYVFLIQCIFKVKGPALSSIYTLPTEYFQLKEHTAPKNC